MTWKCVDLSEVVQVKRSILISCDWYETESGLWKHPDTDEEEYTMEEALEYERESYK